MTPLLIRHRINDLKELASVPKHMGVELDLRSDGQELILHHDPFKPGTRFEDFLKKYDHAFMVVNVKAEGLEQTAAALLRKYKVENYFFLDLSFPAIIKMVRTNESRIAIRFSEYEPVEQCLAMKGKVQWVWIDCFTKYALDEITYRQLKKHFKLCLVSPELQNHPKSFVMRSREKLSRFNFDAICTKHPELWK
ncbi:MAG: hypothetical protein EXS63_05885 [Candidatus Omnitrophica bacterium]|nr:hypothetical protein [Candidatus Omnitrophota bacterium]